MNSERARVSHSVCEGAKALAFPFDFVDRVPSVFHAEAMVDGLGVGVFFFDVKAESADGGVGAGGCFDVLVEGFEDAAFSEIGVDVDALDPPEDAIIVIIPTIEVYTLPKRGRLMVAYETTHSVQLHSIFKQSSSEGRQSAPPSGAGGRVLREAQPQAR